MMPNILKPEATRESKKKGRRINRGGGRRLSLADIRREL